MALRVELTDEQRSKYVNAVSETLIEKYKENPIAIGYIKERTVPAFRSLLGLPAEGFPGETPLSVTGE